VLYSNLGNVSDCIKTNLK